MKIQKKWGGGGRVGGSGGRVGGQVRCERRSEVFVKTQNIVFGGSGWGRGVAGLRG